MAKMVDDVLFSNLRDKLFTAVVGDVLDRMGAVASSCRRRSDRCGPT